MARRWSGVGKMPEYHMQMVLETQARELGYLYFHDRNPISNKRGFPDLHVVGHGRQFVLELKTEDGNPSAEQLRWLHEYQHAGRPEAHLIRPADLEDVIKLFQDGYQQAFDRRSRSGR